MFNTVRRKKLIVLGFAFKKDTGDTRETAAINVCGRLMVDGAICHVYDPKVSREQMLIEFASHNFNETDVNFKEQLVFVDNSVSQKERGDEFYENMRGAHAIVILTEWDEFKYYDYEKIFTYMQKPAFVFDGRNILDPVRISKIGYEYHSVGRPVYKNGQGVTKAE